MTADGDVTKVLSTPDDLVRAVRGPSPRDAAGTAARPELLAHGTTVATNALLERRGAAVALVTNEGLADVIEIGRQDRPSLYDQLAPRPSHWYRGWRYEVAGAWRRTGPSWRPSIPRDPGHRPGRGGGGGVPAPRRHRAGAGTGVAEALRARGHDVSCSHEVSPEMREVERTVTTVINAALRPRCRPTCGGVADLADDALVTTSAGGLLPAAEAAELPAALLLSGPAGGVRAGAAAAVANGFPDAITFDMGGTSTDVCLVIGGSPAPAAEREVAGFTVRFPALDVHTIGAGAAR